MLCSPDWSESPAHCSIKHIKTFNRLYVKHSPQEKCMSLALSGSFLHISIAATQWVSSQGGAAPLKGLYSSCSWFSLVFKSLWSHLRHPTAACEEQRVHWVIRNYLSWMARTCVYGNTQDSKLTTRTTFLWGSLESQSKIMDHNAPNCPLVQTEGWQ